VSAFPRFGNWLYCTIYLCSTITCKSIVAIDNNILLTFDVVQLTTYIVALSHYLVDGNDFHLLRQEVTFNQGATTGTTQSVSINIIDDSLVEGTESFVVSGSVKTLASFVPGGDTVTVNILDNDGELELVYTQSHCLYHNCRKKECTSDVILEPVATIVMATYVYTCD